MRDCDLCKNFTLSPMSDVCRTCGIAMLNFEKRSLTNYDRVHAMNEEEFAQWLCDIAGWLQMFEGRVHPILDWLRQEVDE